jgi:DNA repair protein SbcD/Mre11
MKFAHLADSHVGAWREPKLREVSNKAFTIAIDRCIEENVDFVLFAGDLFNTSMPAIDAIKLVATKFRQLKENNIPVYAIAGSHDFSPTGKTMLDVLEGAGLLINVTRGEIVDNKLRLKFTIDAKTGARITGLLGKRGMLDRIYYENLDVTNLEKEEGTKIFLFHTAITELKPKKLEKMNSYAISFLPKNFEYYAGGHVHIVSNTTLEEAGYKNVIYPGPLYPNSFSEIEELHHGGFYLYDNGTTTYQKLELHPTVCIKLDCNHKNPSSIQNELQDLAKQKKDELVNAIVTLRLFGKLDSGKISEISFHEVFDKFYSSGAYVVLKNTNALETPQMTEIKIDTSKPEEIEDNLINEHLGQIKVTNMNLEKEKHLTKSLLTALNTSRDEGEKVADFDLRLKDEVKKILEID